MVSNTIQLTNSAFLPTIGLGTWSMDNTEEAVGYALTVGYRHIDTATIYGNEADVGAAVAKSGIQRENIFITTKLWTSDQGYRSTFDAFAASLKRLNMEYVDLYLIHWPILRGDNAIRIRTETWQALEEIYKSGRARVIGVSNYSVGLLREMESYAVTPPMVNQIESHPFFIQDDVIRYCRGRNIAVVSYSPLTRGKWMDHPTISSIATAHKKSPAQVLLRWGLELGNVVIPKAGKREHIRENFDIYDFSLTDKEIKELNALDERRSVY